MRTVGRVIVAGLLILATCGRVEAQQNAANGELGVYQVRPNFYMIAGAGANIAVQIGEDGVVLVDAGSSSMASKVLETIQKLTPRPIRYIIDTSAEADHVGGNASLSKAGQNLNILNGAGGPNPGTAAPILSTEEVLNRMSAPTGKQGAFPSDGWPTETFFTPERTMYFNDDGIELLRQPGAHSDGDVFVLFRRADVVMAGDIIDTDHFPVIDIEKGGGVQGEIAALNRLIRLAIPPTPLVWKGGGTRVIPGHGFICDQADIVEYRDMVVIIRDIIQDLIKQGKTLDQIKEANPTEAYRPRYGADSGPWTTDQFVESIYKSLVRRAP